MEHQISSLGASVTVGDQSDQMLEPPQPENVGATKLVDATPEEHNQGDQSLEPPQSQDVGVVKPVEPTPEEEHRKPKVSASGQD